MRNELSSLIRQSRSPSLRKDIQAGVKVGTVGAMWESGERASRSRKQPLQRPEGCLVGVRGSVESGQWWQVWSRVASSAPVGLGLLF